MSQGVAHKEIYTKPLTYDILNLRSKIYRPHPESSDQRSYTPKGPLCS